MNNQVEQENEIQSFFLYFFSTCTYWPGSMKSSWGKHWDLFRFLLLFQSQESSWMSQRNSIVFFLNFDSFNSLSWIKLNKKTRFDRFSLFLSILTKLFQSQQSNWVKNASFSLFLYFFSAWIQSFTFEESNWTKQRYSIGVTIR